MASLSDLAKLVAGELIGDNLEISGASGIEDAGPGEITFAATLRAIESASISKATAMIVPLNT